MTFYPPLLPVIVMEVLSSLLLGFSVGPRHVGAFYISLLLFADDTLIFFWEKSKSSL
jgi:hypothetical protein